MIVTLATPVANAVLTQAIAETCGAQIVSCASEDLVAKAPLGDALVLPGMWYSPALAEALAAPSSRCRKVQFLSAGYDRLEEAARPAGVGFARVTGLWGGVTAEHTLSLLLALTRRIPEAVRAQDRQEWQESLRPSMTTLDGATVAILGTGEVGAAIAVRLGAFGAAVTGISRSGAANPAFAAVVTMKSRDAVLAGSDIVIVAVPYSSETHHLVDTAFLAGMMQGALFINVSRGGVIEQDALLAALQGGQLGGAAVDVTDPEPLPAGDPLWTAPNLLLTPHVGGGAPPRFYGKLADYVAHNIAAWNRGEMPEGLIA